MYNDNVVIMICCYNNFFCELIHSIIGSVIGIGSSSPVLIGNRKIGKICYRYNSNIKFKALVCSIGQIQKLYSVKYLYLPYTTCLYLYLPIPWYRHLYIYLYQYWYNTKVQYNMYSTVQYVQYCTYCTVQYNMYSTVQYVQYCTICTVQYNMYSTVKY